MLAAAERFSASDLKNPIYITCTADEEVGYGGASQVAQRSGLFREMLEGNSRGIIGEPTMLEVVYAHKGTYGFSATSKGRAAHSSNSQGINANLAMIPFLSEMKEIYDETSADPAWQSDEFDPPGISWNIGINDHTKAVNITPPQSVCTVYFRPIPGQDADKLIDRARQAAERCGIDFEILWLGRPLYVDPKSDFVEETVSLVGKEKPRTAPYGTDGCMLTAMERLLLLGPGSVAQAHTFDEWISLAQIEQGTDTYTKLIRAWCS
jgi:acetylornithine deacetylase